MRFLVLTDIHNNWVFLDEMLSLANENDGVLFLGDLMPFGKAKKEAFNNFQKICDATNFCAGVPGNGALPEVVQYFHDLGISVHGKSVTMNGIDFFGVGGASDPVAMILQLRTFFKEERPRVIDLSERALETLDVFGIAIQDGMFVVQEWSEEEERSLERYRSPFEHSDEEIYKILTQGFPSDTRNNLSFLLSHVPPFEGGLNSDLPEGASTGSKGITKFVMEFHPSRVLSGHYHSSHDFQIDSTPCNIVPAAKDGYYAILEVDSDTKSHQLSIETFY